MEETKEETKSEKKKKEKEKKSGKWWVLGSGTVIVVALIIGAITIFWADSESKIESKRTEKEFFAPARAATVKAEQVQIHPNYEFPEGINQIKVPLIPVGQVLSCEAGGWVTTPHGSRYEIDYKTTVTIEYIDGRKVHREPNKPVWDDVRIENRVFRIYGQEGQFAEVRIKRGAY